MLFADVAWPVRLRPRMDHRPPPPLKSALAVDKTSQPQQQQQEQQEQEQEQEEEEEQQQTNGTEHTNYAQTNNKQ